MCGILGLFSHQEVFSELVYGLTALQHRGQDAAGIVTFDRTFFVKKGEGLANEIFVEKDGYNFPGKMGLGHMRYTTQGRALLSDAQPFTLNYPYGLAMVHNGNVTNFLELQRILVEKYHCLIESTNDIELILLMLAVELTKTDLNNLTTKTLFQAAQALQATVRGAYAILSLIANKGLLAIMDPNGIRPLVLGRKETNSGPQFAFASESNCLDFLGYEVIHNLQAGEMIFIDQNKHIHSSIGLRRNKAFCVFEYVYFAKEDSIVHHRLVAQEREHLGMLLAKYFLELKLKPDIVIDVPSSAYFYAQGLSEALGIPYKRGLIKNNHAKRSFISPTQQLREKIVRQKLNPIKSIIQGKKIAVIDDSLVRGTTSKHIVTLLRNAGAKAIYFISGSPPIKFPCIYGIDMSKREEMVASRFSQDQICEYIGADELIYPTIEDLRNTFLPQDHCDACFSGTYPTDVSKQLFDSIKEEKQLSCR